MLVAAAISRLLQLVADKLAPPLVGQLGSALTLALNIKSDLQKLSSSLRRIKSILGDAEDREPRNEAIGHWLRELKHVADDAEDFIEELHSEALVQSQNNTLFNKVCKFSGPKFIYSRYAIGKTLNDIIMRMDRLADESHQFNFALEREFETVKYSRAPTHSRVQGAQIIGRDKDKEEIINLLIQCNNINKVELVSIVGMGGLGKTSLAQLVYNDPKIQDHFQLKMWICVPDDFDVTQILKSIISVARKEECVTNNLELLQEDIRNYLMARKYLLVLDDVCSANMTKWDALYDLLNSGMDGSKILVTTRSNQVSTLMRVTSSYQLQVLSNEDSWTLFKQRAFNSELEHESNLIEVGQEIAKKCGGLPLAITVLASALWSKTPDEWFLIKNSEFFELEGCKEEILPILRISYNALPSHVKQCFAFCAIFPKGHVMEKDTLIQLWMANGFIASQPQQDSYAQGDKVFKELTRRSFFF